MNKPPYRSILFASLGLLPAGCMFSRTGIDRQMNQQLTNDRAEVNTTREDYHDSVLESGLYSGESKTALDNMGSAQRKLAVDRKQFDDYNSASGQSSVPRE